MVFLLYFFAAWYVLIASLLFRAWFKYVERDRPVMSGRERWLSMLMVCLSSSLWIFSLPLTYLELLKKQSKQAVQSVEPTVQSLELVTKESSEARL